MFIGITGLLLAVIGLMALWLGLPDQYDAYGIKVTLQRLRPIPQALYADGTTRPRSRVVTPHYSYVAPWDPVRCPGVVMVTVW